MSMYDVHQALTQSFIDLALGIEISHENVDIDPTNDAPFVALTVLPSEEESLGKLPTGSDENFGIFQASFYTPSGESVGEILPLIDTTLAFYRHNVSVTANSQVVTIVSANRNGGRNSNGWYVYDVSINYKTDIARA